MSKPNRLYETIWITGYRYCFLMFLIHLCRKSYQPKQFQNYTINKDIKDIYIFNLKLTSAFIKSNLTIQTDLSKQLSLLLDKLTKNYTYALFSQRYLLRYKFKKVIRVVYISLVNPADILLQYQEILKRNKLKIL